MPVVNKQSQKTTRPSLVVPVVNGILGRAIAVEKLEVAPLKILMYGANRVGKTTLACEFPKPLLLVSFEPSSSGGAESVRKKIGVRVLQEREHFTGTEGAVELARELSQGDDPYRTVVIDSATSLQDVVLRELMGTEEAPLQQNFGVVSGDQYRMRSEKTREILHEFLKLKRDMIVLAKERDHNPPKEERISEKSGKVQPDMRAKFLRGLQQESFIAADLGGATVGWLQDACDCICRLYVEKEVVEEDVEIMKGQTQKISRETGRYVRYLRTGYHPNFAAGIRSCDPEKVPEVIEKPTYAKILKAIRG